MKQYQEQCTPENIMQILENSSSAKRKVVCQSEGVNTYTLLEINDIHIQQTSFFSRLQMLDM
ncbi:MAG: hypothetical protein WCH65_08960 [bacterium]